MVRILAQLPDDLPDKAGQIVDQVKANPVLLAMLIGVGVLTAIIFLWGIVRQALKAVVFGGLLSAGAWYWYFSVR
jgi:hypothetical protein